MLRAANCSACIHSQNRKADNAYIMFAYSPYTLIGSVLNPLQKLMRVVSTRLTDRRKSNK